jgi:hypothetical protein
VAAPINFDVLYGGVIDGSAPPSKGTINFDALYGAETGTTMSETPPTPVVITSVVTPAQPTTPSPAPTPPTPTTPPPSSDVKLADTIAGTAAAVVDAAAPGAVEGSAPTSVETKVLSVEDFAGKLMSLIPAVSVFAGFVPSAELATHVGFVAFKFFSELFHHAQKKKAAAQPAK